MEEIYRWLYDNLEIFGEEEKQDTAVIVIKQGLVGSVVCGSLVAAADVVRAAIMK